MPILPWLVGIGLTVGLIAIAHRYSVDGVSLKEIGDDDMPRTDGLLVPQPKLSQFDLAYVKAHGVFPVGDYKGRSAVPTSNKFQPGKHHGCDVMNLRRTKGTKNGPLPGYPGKTYFMVSPEIPIAIRAFLPGRVSNVYQKPGGGLSVTIDHGEVPGIGPLRSFYQHCHRVMVKVGQWVEAGEEIAIVGRSGTNVNHLHFELWLTNRRYVYKDGKGKTRYKSNSNIWAINPAPFLAVAKHWDAGYPVA